MFLNINLKNVKLLVGVSFIAGVLSATLLNPTHSNAVGEYEVKKERLEYSDAVKQELDKYYAQKRKITGDFKDKKEAMKLQMNQQIKDLEGTLSAEAKRVVDARRDKQGKKHDSEVAAGVVNAAPSDNAK